MSDLRALAERLEKATGADREIDLDLMVLGWGGPREQYLTDELGRLEFGFQHPFTSSLDAAVALCERVLPGYRKAVEQCVHSEAGWKAWVQILWGPESNRRWEAQAPTPALALCLAIVRAKLAEQAND